MPIPVEKAAQRFEAILLVVSNRTPIIHKDTAPQYQPPFAELACKIGEKGQRERSYASTLIVVR